MASEPQPIRTPRLFRFRSEIERDAGAVVKDRVKDTKFLDALLDDIFGDIEPRDLLPLDKEEKKT